MSVFPVLGPFRGGNGAAEEGRDEFGEEGFEGWDGCADHGHVELEGAPEGYVGCEVWGGEGWLDYCSW